MISYSHVINQDYLVRQSPLGIAQTIQKIIYGLKNYFFTCKIQTVNQGEHS